jgi:hypothetical protein
MCTTTLQRLERQAASCRIYSNSLSKTQYSRVLQTKLLTTSAQTYNFKQLKMSVIGANSSLGSSCPMIAYSMLSI